MIPERWPDAPPWESYDFTEGQSIVIVRFNENLLNAGIVMFVDVDRLEPHSVSYVADLRMRPEYQLVESDFLSRRLQVIQQLIEQDAILYCEKQYWQSNTLIITSWLLHHKIRHADALIQFNYLTGQYMWWYI
jgi:predicted metal-dependent HD superfamily phosphohydrolase